MSGLFGVISQPDCRELLFFGTDYLSHLGTEYGGLAVHGDDFIREIHDISHDQFKSRFFYEYKKMAGPKGIGVISAVEPQPMLLDSKVGAFAICVDGNIENKRALASELRAQGISFGDTRRGVVNTAELVGTLISMGEDIVDGIQKMFDRIDGGISILLLTRDGIYAARDRYGHSPLVLGENGNTLAVTTETNAFPNLGLKAKKFIAPGEILFLSEQGVKQCAQGIGECQICAFLWIYTGFPASHYEGINVEIVRERCGANLARGDDVKADLVTGVPDSGTSHAIGYAMASGIPYRRPLVKYTQGYGRSYTPPSQETRDLIARMKLIPIKEVIQGNRIVICDDSIVRGTQLKNFTIHKLWENGAKEVHVRIACPPLMFPCRYNVSTRSVDELAARCAIKALEGSTGTDVSDYVDPTTEKYRRMVNWIANELGVTSLKYQTLPEMVAAIGLPQDRLCTYCWNGCGTGCRRDRTPTT